MPPEPLDYAELQKAADKLMRHINFNGSSHDYEVVILALADIAQRALEWAARTDQAFHPDSFDRYIGESPRVLLSNALAALNAPDTDTPKPRTMPLTDAEVLNRLPPYITTVSGKKLTNEELNALVEVIRCA